jgi:oligopeptide transport system permease protein
MLRNIIHRLLQGLLVLYVLGTLTFFLVHALPYGPFQDEKAVPEHVMERLEKLHGYDKPLYTQYFLRLKNIAAGQPGHEHQGDGRTQSE